MDEQDKKFLKKAIRTEVLIGLIVSFLLISAWHVFLAWHINQIYLYDLCGTWASEDGSFTLNRAHGAQDGHDAWAVLTIDEKEYNCEVYTRGKSLVYFVVEEKNKEQNSEQTTDYAVWDAKVTVKEKGNVLKVEIIKDYLSDDEGEVIVLYRQ